MSAPATPSGAPSLKPPRKLVLDGLFFLCAVAGFLAVEAVTRKSASGPGLMQIVYWCLVVVQSLLGLVLVLVVGFWFLLSEVLPWWLRLFAPEQWRVWQDKLAARGGPPSRFYWFTFACYFFGGLAMLLPAARMLLASGG